MSSSFDPLLYRAILLVILTTPAGTRATSYRSGMIKPENRHPLHRVAQRHVSPSRRPRLATPPDGTSGERQSQPHLGHCRLYRAATLARQAGKCSSHATLRVLPVLEPCTLRLGVSYVVVVRRCSIHRSDILLTVVLFREGSRKRTIRATSTPLNAPQ